MDGSASTTTIASCGLFCAGIFPLLAEGLKSSDSDLTSHLPESFLEEESKRFELWARNIAALQDARLPSSLEYRIRNDQNAINIVKKSLSYLQESLDMALAIVSGKKENQTWPSPPVETEALVENTSQSKADSDVQHTSPSQTGSELKELGLAIKEAITNLFELSMIIRKKPEQDEYLKAAAKHPLNPTADIVHVGDKYARTRSGDLWLRERLGTAITRRRQYLLYRREHQKMMEETHVINHVDGKTVWSGEKASTYQQGDTFQPGQAEITLTMTQAVSKPARTEYADSSRGKDGALDLLRTPLLPKNADGVRAQYGQHFECSLCWRPQMMQNKNEWKKHVFSDLRPYVCTFEECGLNMFESQHQWFDHELRFHRKQYLCPTCNDNTPITRPQLEAHISNFHPGELVGNALGALSDSAQIPRIDAADCPLCFEYGEKFRQVNQSQKCDVSLNQFQMHLGRHMEQLALSALPEEDLDEEHDSLFSYVDSELSSSDNPPSQDGDSRLETPADRRRRRRLERRSQEESGHSPTHSVNSNDTWETMGGNVEEVLQPGTSRGTQILRRMWRRKEKKPIVFDGDLDQVQTVAEQEESEYEPRADAIRGSAALMRRISRRERQSISISRFSSDDKEESESYDERIGRRPSRKVVPGLPRLNTFKRQESETRDRLEPATPLTDERRAASMLWEPDDPAPQGSRRQFSFQNVFRAASNANEPVLQQRRPSTDF